MALYQPNFSDGETETLAAILIEAADSEEAQRKAQQWFDKQEEMVQKYFVPTTYRATIKNMIYRKPNPDGILILP